MRKLVTAAVTLALAVAVAPIRAEVPTPSCLTPGETPSPTNRNHPFFATDIVLSNFGYVEEEFAYSGTANTIHA